MKLFFSHPTNCENVISLCTENAHLLTHPLNPPPPPIAFYVCSLNWCFSMHFKYSHTHTSIQSTIYVLFQAFLLISCIVMSRWKAECYSAPEILLKDVLKGDRISTFCRFLFSSGMFWGNHKTHYIAIFETYFNTLILYVQRL